MARRQPIIITRETNIPAPPGSKEIALAIFAKWIVQAEKQRLEDKGLLGEPEKKTAS